MKEIYNPRSLPSVAVGEEVAPFLGTSCFCMPLLCGPGSAQLPFLWPAVPPASSGSQISKFSPVPVRPECLGPSLMPGSCLHQVSEVSTDHPVLHIKHLDLWVMSWTEGI